MSGVYDIPPDPVRGQPVMAEWGIKIGRVLRQLQLRSSDTVKANVTVNGTTLEAKGRRGGPAAVALLPWQPLDVSTANEARVAFHPGFINGEAPTIEVEEAPVSILEDPAPYLVVTASTSFWFKVEVNAADDVTSYEIIQSSATPGTSYTPGAGGTAYLRFSAVSVSTGGILGAPEHYVRGNLLFLVGDGYGWNSTP